MYNGVMKLRLFSWIEFLIWFIILSLCIGAYRYHRYAKAKELPSYQIFMPDVDGMIVGSPVRYMGVQVGYIRHIKIMYDTTYVRFVLTDKDLRLPEGVIASVEFNGLGGSKSLELYPPDENENSKNLIVVKRHQRLNESLGLLNDMFGKIGSISARFTHFGKQMGVIHGNEIELNPENIGKQIKKNDEFVEHLLKNREEFKNKLKGRNSDEQCESDQ